MKLDIGRALGLRPLDRVQIVSRSALYELRNWQHRGAASAELPHLFFQRVLEDGNLLLRTPGGATVSVHPTEACSMVPGEPIEVMAMPQMHFFEVQEWRRSNPTAENPSFFKPGYLTHVMKDRWGRLAMAWVAFHDKRLNESWSFANPLTDGDRERVSELMNRRRMPVLGPGSASESAVHGLDQQASKEHYASRQFFKAALAGNTSKASALASFSIKPLSTAAINRMQPG
ncbi:MAG: hypothetical protein Q8S02_16675 [Hydrogenophaga sp.]|nr:hypothetical protein [Hydrogenophaga sp.]